MAITALQFCIWCSEAFQPKKPWQKACCYKCSYSFRNDQKKRGQTNFKDCARCGTSLADKNARAIYCSTTCKSLDHNFKHRSKTRTKSIARRRLLWERDSGICYMCNEFQEFDKFELDHLVPVAYGGNNEPDNLAVSCTKCNRSRGTRIETKQLSKLLELGQE